MADPPDLYCAICERKIIIERSIITKDSTCCGKLQSVHLHCAKQYFKYTNPSDSFSTEHWTTKTNISLLCSVCKESCFFCRKYNHTRNNNSAEIIHCKNEECSKWCYAIMPTKNIRKNGCLFQTNLKLEDAFCTDCSEVKKSNESGMLPSIRFIDDTEKSEHLSVISSAKYLKHHDAIHALISTFLIGNDTEDKGLSTLDDCQRYIDLHYSHLSPKTDNVFSVNSKTQETVPGFYLTKNTLERLVGIKNDGWLNDIIFTQVMDLLNFNGEYCSATKLAGGLVPNVVFGDTFSDGHKVNPKFNYREYKQINKDVPDSIINESSKVKKDFAYEMKKWYGNYSRLKLDFILSFYDRKELKVKHYCAPLNLNNDHWVTLDVSLPNKEFNNGRVMITNHMHKDGISKNTRTKFMPTYYSQMWWAKFFGIYNKEKCGVVLNQTYFSFKDMNCTSFSLKDHPEIFFSSTLDHMENEDPNTYLY